MTTSTASTETKVNQLQQTVDPASLTLADWAAIANQLSFKAGWAWNNWLAVPQNREQAEKWDLNTLQAASKLLGFAIGWAVNRYKEFHPEEFGE